MKKTTCWIFLFFVTILGQGCPTELDFNDPEDTPQIDSVDVSDGLDFSEEETQAEIPEISESDNDFLDDSGIIEIQEITETETIETDDFLDGPEIEELEMTCEDLDSDGYPGTGEACDPESPDFDCDDFDRRTNPGADEVCNNIDDNCNHRVDEGLGMTSCGIGICKQTIQNCVGGIEQNCDPFQGAVDEECNGVDDNCDGDIDEGCPCVYDVEYNPTQDCYPGSPGTRGVGLCRAGSQECLSSGQWGLCEGYITPSAETCDGEDNDCDDSTDEVEDLGTTTCGLGVCEHTVDNCVAGESQVCDPFVGSSDEVCNGLDDDCDGTIDNDVPNCCEPGEQRDCGTDVGECEFGIQFCTEDLSWGRCFGAVGPSEEICDGKDNDCDGRADSSENLTRQCGETDVGECKFGTETCDDMGNWVGCDAVEPSDEVCNGLNDDCDGETDEELGTTTCGLGVCEHTIDNCVAGEPQVCDTFAGASEEICDGMDNDCDGILDDSENLTRQCGINIGECDFGTEICDDLGNWVDCDAVEPADEVCDELDNDCDGFVDEDFDPTNDPGNCGGCNHACTALEWCENSYCIAAMVEIPAGSFLRGCDDWNDPMCHDENKPRYEVILGVFQIDITEVTVSQYGACVEGGSCSDPTTTEYCNWGEEDREDHPINCISFFQAEEYCSWVGKRLCNDNEWEKAARGTDGRNFPWGNAPPAVSCNNSIVPAVEPSSEWGCNMGSTWPVASKPAGVGPFGIYDAIGNVAEWTNDSNGEQRVSRGGTFSSYRWWLLLSARPAFNPSIASYERGVRCCRDSTND